MAIRERKGRASPWQVYWNNPFTGKRECANFATKEEALKEDSLIKHRLKFERESFQKMEVVENEEPQELTLEQVYLLYLREKQFNKKGLQWQLDSMRVPLHLYGNRPIVDIGKRDFEQIMHTLNTPNVKLLTVRIRMCVLRAVIRWAAEKNYCSMPIFPKLPKAESERFIPPTIEEIDAILEVAPDHIQRVVILGVQCGARIGPCELFQLKWDDVDFTQRILRIHGSRKNLKAQWREIPLKEQMTFLLCKWKSKDMERHIPWIIHFNGKAIVSIKTAWNKTLQRAGIQRHIRPYDLRHAFATELIANGADIGTVAKLMGHSTPTMILNHYQYVMDKQKKQAIDALPEINMCPSPCAQKKRDCDFIRNPLK